MKVYVMVHVYKPNRKIKYTLKQYPKACQTECQEGFTVRKSQTPTPQAKGVHWIKANQ